MEGVVWAWCGGEVGGAHRAHSARRGGRGRRRRSTGAACPRYRRAARACHLPRSPPTHTSSGHGVRVFSGNLMLCSACLPSVATTLCSSLAALQRTSANSACGGRDEKMRRPAAESRRRADEQGRRRRGGRDVCSSHVTLPTARRSPTRRARRPSVQARRTGRTLGAGRRRARPAAPPAPPPAPPPASE